jgi:hypothetical protein
MVEPAAECCFPLVSGGYPDLIISCPKIELRLTISCADLVKNFLREGQGVLVLDGDFVYSPVVRVRVS